MVYEKARSGAEGSAGWETNLVRVRVRVRA